MIASVLSQIKLKPSTAEEEEDEEEEEEEKEEEEVVHRVLGLGSGRQLSSFFPPFGANKTGGNDLSTPKPNPKP
jgi:hypothetical protein